MKKAFLNWSSGKDAAFALFELQQGNDFSVEKLVTTIDATSSTVSMHGLRKELLLQQVNAVGIPLHLISLDGFVPVEEYNRIMKREMDSLKAEGFTHSVFGDIFLEDLREFREEQLKKAGLTAVFPLWKMDTQTLMRDFLKAGFKAITVSVNAKDLDRSFCGRIINETFLADLPEGVDPAGENGEYHSFVYDGPYFKEPVAFRRGEVSEKISGAPKKDKKQKSLGKQPSWDTRFWYCDLLPKHQKG
ncbi:ATP-binding protein [Salinimicrobium soli]|uniref:Dph6-related ATP pyrophosphatase n=1 Tax=Salinimicrobium soli TaxID=1254399 RepID=UPI003AAA2A89